jgi:hypothetical protein
VKVLEGEVDEDALAPAFALTLAFEVEGEEEEEEEAVLARPRDGSIQARCAVAEVKARGVVA